MKTIVKSKDETVSLHVPMPEIREVKKILPFRAKPSQITYWKNEAKKLGVKDFSAFIRGSLDSAIFVSQRANDPNWQKFIKVIQPIAQKMLGHGFFDGGAVDFESRGVEYKTYSAKAFFDNLKKNDKKLNVHRKIQNL